MILSICIPTYNRADKLDRLLISIENQSKLINETFEVVISDNYSNDDTYKVISKFKNKINIKYHKNNSNIGPVKNIIKLVSELSNGKYIWIIGDDDTIEENSIEKIYKIIRENQDVKYIYANYEKNKYSLASNNFNNKIIPFGEIIRLDPNALTPIYCSIFLKEIWLKFSFYLNIQDDYTNIDSTYPHTVILTRALYDDFGWYSEDKLIKDYGKNTTWSQYSDAVICKRFQELINFMKIQGIKEEYLFSHRNRFNHIISKISLDLLLGKKIKFLNKKDAIILIMKNFYKKDFFLEFIHYFYEKISNIPKKLKRKLICKRPYI